MSGVSGSELERPEPAGLRRPAAPAPSDVQARAAEAARGTIAYLRDLQDEDGSWCAELEGDTILESEYILTMLYLGRAGEPKLEKAAEYIRRQQRAEGGWSTYPGGVADPSVSTKAYFVLKLLGDDPESEPMVRARRAILEAGGIEACNSFTKIYLAIFGQYDWERCPAVPPEIILFPKWFPFNLYEMSSWSRAIVVPLSVMWAFKPRHEVPAHADISELSVGRDVTLSGVSRYTGTRNAWTRFFDAADTGLKILERTRFRPLRSRALERAERWIRARLPKSHGLGAIFPPIINTIIAFRCLGYDLDDPALASQVEELERLEIEDEETLRVQPCFSALWDTAQVTTALLASGVPGTDDAVRRASRWMLDREVTEKGDWAVKLPNVPPGGWYFEYANEWYPDCDDTAEVLLALAQVTFPTKEEESEKDGAVRRALRWLLAMQNDDGGWAAFDRACDRPFLQHVPFADHNAMLDPSCEDITARVLDALHAQGFSNDHPAVRRGVKFILDRQHEDGSWYGRWGCNFVYGTWLSMVGLRAAGVAESNEQMQRGAVWLREVQNDDGGWGETPLSYDDPERKGDGPSTAAQTAWALLGLFAAGDRESEAVRRGVDHLLRTRQASGQWHDEAWTGTGFPRVFYLRYHLYATQFPLIALADYARGDGGGGERNAR